MSEIIDVIISETCGAVLVCDPEDAPRKVVSYSRFRQLERSVETQVATPTPDVAGLVVEARKGIDGKDWRDVKRVRSLLFRVSDILESLSRERAVLAELLRQCAIDRHVSFCQSTKSFEQCSLRMCFDVRKALALIEGKE